MSAPTTLRREKEARFYILGMIDCERDYRPQTAPVRSASEFAKPPRGLGRRPTPAPPLCTDRRPKDSSYRTPERWSTGT
jgi:hypothetical protein